MASGKVSDAEAGRPEFDTQQQAFVTPTPGRKAALRACNSQCRGSRKLQVQRETLG